MTVVRMAAVGDNVVDRYVDEGIMYPGGSATNAAVFGRRLGMHTGYIGVRGDDPEGEHIHGALAQEGVDLSRMRVVADPTSVTDVRIHPTGNREFLRYVPMAAPIVLESQDLDYLSGYDWVHTGHTSEIETQLAALARCGPVGFDFSHRRLDYAGELLPHVTFATFSGEGLSTDDALALARTVARTGVRYAVVTRGSAPVVAVGASEEAVFPIDPVDAVDALGAGDAFQVAFEKAIIEGGTLDDAVTAAASFAATVCMTPGAFGHAVAIDPAAGRRDLVHEPAAGGGSR
jgi:fructoselysine 6-kinase